MKRRALSGTCSSLRREVGRALRTAEILALFTFWLLCPRAVLGSFELHPTDPVERGSATALAAGLTGSPPAGGVRGSAPESASSEPAHRLRPGAVKAYGFRPFGIPEIEFGALVVQVPVGSSLETLKLSYERLSAQSYTEEVYLVSARVAGRRWLIEPGVRLGLVRGGETFRDHVCLIDLGAEIRPARPMKLAARVRNLLGSGLAGEGSRCPMGITAGVGLAASDYLGFGVEIEKETGLPLGVASGMEFHAARGLALRAGARSHPREISCGLGLRRGPLGLDVASSVNFELGATHEAGLTVFIQ